MGSRVNMAFEWMNEMSPLWREARDVFIGVACCLLIGIPMVLIRHKYALKKAQGKMD